MYWAQVFVFVGASALGYYYWCYESNDSTQIVEEPATPRSEQSVPEHLESFNALEERELSKEELEGLSRKVLKKTNNDGEPIFMVYNSKLDSFQYWADKRDIPYEVLDSMAMEYAVKYNCKSVCVNLSEKTEKENGDEEEGKEDTEAGEEEKRERLRAVYARFKNYNKNKTPLIAEANSFRRAGNLDDYCLPPVTTQPSNESSYASWSEKSKSV